jgi:hypothetical protein
MHESLVDGVTTEVVGVFLQIVLVPNNLFLTHYNCTLQNISSTDITQATNLGKFSPSLSSFWKQNELWVIPCHRLSPPRLEQWSRIGSAPDFRSLYYTRMVK